MIQKCYFLNIILTQQSIKLIMMEVSTENTKS
jgi:hypothetical protein